MIESFLAFLTGVLLGAVAGMFSAYHHVELFCDKDHELDLGGHVYFCVRADQAPAP